MEAEGLSEDAILSLEKKVERTMLSPSKNTVKMMVSHQPGERHVTIWSNHEGAGCYPDLLSKYGASTQYDHTQGTPFSQNSILLFSSLEGHTIGNCGDYTGVAIKNLHITVSATDPFGNVMNGQTAFVIGVSGAQASVSSGGTFSDLMNLVKGVIASVVPYGAASWLPNVNSDSRLTSTTTASGAYADWTCGGLCLNQQDMGLLFTYQFYVDATKLGTYTITISYHQATIDWLSSGKYTTQYTTSADVSQQLTYCYVTCTPPSTPSGPTSVAQWATAWYTTSVTSAVSIEYQFDWGDGTTTTTGWYASGVTASAGHAWDYPGTWYVRVRATDGNGWTAWSPTKYVNVGTQHCPPHCSPLP